MSCVSKLSFYLVRSVLPFVNNVVPIPKANVLPVRYGPRLEEDSWWSLWLAGCSGKAPPLMGPRRTRCLRGDIHISCLVWSVVADTPVRGRSVLQVASRASALRAGCGEIEASLDNDISRQSIGVNWSKLSHSAA